VPVKIDPSQCAKCKGARRLCGRPVCPIIIRLSASYNVSKNITGKSIFGSTPPSILVGESHYPFVRLGPNIPLEVGSKAREYDAPELWWGNKSLEDIIKLRASLIFSSFYANAKIDARISRNKMLEALREVAMSELPVDTEALLKKRPIVSLKFDGVLAPIGPRADVLKFKIVSNPIVPRKVDTLISDFDVDARTASYELYSHGVSYYHIVRLFSLGLLGEKRYRRVVPTRWAITATDKILGDKLLSKVKDYKEFENYTVFQSEYIGNRYFLLFVPRVWSFEMIEIWLPRSVWVRGRKPYIVENYELVDGKARKADIDGGYYAIRFPVLEYLEKIKRQASVFAFREITPDYYAPVGSWQIRESVRAALRGQPRTFSSLEEALKYVSTRLSVKFENVYSIAQLLKFIVKQETLTKFLS